nr:putative ribosome-binding factor A; mitochondrial [Biomphalaria glabrata]
MLAITSIRNNKILCLMYSVQSKSLNVLFQRLESDYASHESSKFMKKLLNRNAKAKKKWYQSHLGEPNEVMGSLFKAGRKKVNEAQIVRARQLGHVLYDKISELINTEELSTEIVCKQVLITSVKMLNDFSGINVYWDCNRSDAAEVESLLHSCSGKLRSLLISYHVLGRIPPVTFVKDKSFVDLSHLNLLLEVADYGPDYVPSTHQKTNDANHSQSSSAETTAAPPVPFRDLPDSNNSINIKANQAFSSLQSGTQNETECSILTDQPVGLDFKFRSDIYGLPRDKLYQKVMAQKMKGRYQESDNDNTLGALQESSSNHLNFQHYKLKPKFKESNSNKVKQQRVENDFIEFHKEQEN